MKSKLYRNRTTGAVTESQAEAMAWYRAGYSVEVWRNDRMILAFNALGI